tara:strand:- start:60 stop:257 length:198 start_codon:yes stop_codon:yes gene_type:complete
MYCRTGANPPGVNAPSLVEASDLKLGKTYKSLDDMFNLTNAGSLEVVQLVKFKLVVPKFNILDGS